MKDSQWVHVAQKPTIPGVYKRRDDIGNIGWQRFLPTKKKWGTWCAKFEEAMGLPKEQKPSELQGGYWQGQVD